ncbi:MAG: hypothetical protein EAZ60_27175, partial [Oscillatoriales cyanobacterium]
GQLNSHSARMPIVKLFLSTLFLPFNTQQFAGKTEPILDVRILDAIVNLVLSPCFSGTNL